MNYADLKYKYETTVPIRGRTPKLVPVGDRKRTHEQIIEYTDCYALRLYSSDVLKYYADGRVVVNLSHWNTPTTRDFIHAYLPYMAGLRVNGGRVWLRYCIHYKALPNDGEVWMDTKERIILPSGWRTEKRVVNRETSKMIRTHPNIKAYIQFAEATRALEQRENRGWISGGQGIALDLLINGSMEDFGELYERLDGTAHLRSTLESHPEWYEWVEVPDGMPVKGVVRVVRDER